MIEVRFTCPECDKTFKTSNLDVVGKRIKCPNCSKPIPLAEQAPEERVAPAPGLGGLSRGRSRPDDDEPADARSEEEDESEEDEGQQEKQPKLGEKGGKRRPSRQKGWVTPAGVVVCVIAFLYLVWLVGTLAGPFRRKPLESPYSRFSGGKGAWVEMTTKRGELQFRFPRKVEPRSLGAIGPAGEEWLRYEGRTSEATLEVEEMTLGRPLTPEKVEDELRWLDQRADKARQRTITADRRITLEGYQGREIEIVDGVANRRTKVRKYVIGPHVVTLTWSERKGRAPEEDATRFFDSFRLPKGLVDSGKPPAPVDKGPLVLIDKGKPPTPVDKGPLIPVEKERPPVSKNTGPTLIKPAVTIQCGVGPELTALDVTGDGSRSIVGGPGAVQKIEVWNQSTRIRMFSLDNRPGGYLPVAISSDQRFWAHAADTTVRVRDLRTGGPVHDLRPQGRGPASVPYGLAFSPNGDLIAAAVGKDLVGWSTRTGKQEFAWQSDGVVVSSLSQFVNRGRKIATGGKTGAINVWDVERRVLDRAIRSDFKDQVLGVTGSPDGGWLAAQEISGPIKVWELASGGLIRTIPRDDLPARVAGMAFVPRSKLLIYPTRHGHLLAVDVTTGEVRYKLQDNVREVWGIRVTDDGATVYTPGAGGTIRMWDFRKLR